MEDYKKTTGYSCTCDCNSPKAEFIREYNSWFMTDNVDRILAVLDENIVWEIVGEVTVEGIQQVRQFLSPSPESEAGMETIEQRVDGILVDGSLGSSFGTMILRNGDSYAFSEIIQL